MYKRLGLKEDFFWWNLVDSKHEIPMILTDPKIWLIPPLISSSIPA